MMPEQPSLPFEEERFHSSISPEVEIKRSVDNKSVIFTHFEENGEIRTRVSVPLGSLALSTPHVIESN